jgi:hypothetical protein
MNDVTITMTATVAESVCAKAGIYQYDGQQELADVPLGAWYDVENERFTWALDEATRWAIVRLAEMDFEWEDATSTIEREDATGCAECGMPHPGSHYLGCPVPERANLTLDTGEVSRILALLDTILAPTQREAALQDLAELLREAVMER